MEETGEVKTAMAKTPISTEDLASLAIWLSGFKEGRGNIRPLGTVALDNLWNTIHYLKGDVRFYNPKDEQS